MLVYSKRMKSELKQISTLFASNTPQKSLVSEDFTQVLSQGYETGRAHFGELGLDLNTYSDRIQSITRKNLGPFVAKNETVAFATNLHLRDLYLATACAKEGLGFSTGDMNTANPESPGWKALEKTYRGFIHDLARFLSREHRMAQDLADDILADLFMPDLSGKSRILSYDGRSSLSSWLRAVLANRITNARRSKAYSRTDEITDKTPERAAPVSIDNIVRIKRYGRYLAEAIKAACSQLEAGESLLLLWRYEDGLKLRQIGRLLGIHQSNVTRRLERMYGKLHDEILASLAGTYGLNQDTIAECIHDLVEHPQETISILDFLGARNGGKAEMKHIGEIIREHLQEEEYIRAHEPKILKYYAERAAGPVKKKPVSVVVHGLRSSSGGKELSENPIKQ